MREIPYMVTNQIAPLSTREGLESFKTVGGEINLVLVSLQPLPPDLGNPSRNTSLPPLLGLLQGSLLLPTVVNLGGSPRLCPSFHSLHPPKVTHPCLLASTPIGVKVVLTGAARHVSSELQTPTANCPEHHHLHGSQAP